MRLASSLASLPLVTGDPLVLVGNWPCICQQRAGRLLRTFLNTCIDLAVSLPSIFFCLSSFSLTPVLDTYPGNWKRASAGYRWRPVDVGYVRSSGPSPCCDPNQPGSPCHLNPQPFHGMHQVLSLRGYPGWRTERVTSDSSPSEWYHTCMIAVELWFVEPPRPLGCSAQSNRVTRNH